MARSLDGVQIKRAHSKETFTEDLVVQLAACADPVTGPEYFIENFFHIQHPTKGKILLKPYEYQKKLLNSYHNYRFNINMLPRQMGKCVRGNTTIKIRNKHSGQVIELPIQEFHEMQKNLNNLQHGDNS